MKYQDQIKALAELNGWKLLIQNTQGMNFVKPDGDIATYWASGNQTDMFHNWLTSYDAIIPLIQKQSSEIKWLFVAHLVPQLRPGQFQWDATPSQPCEALLRATNKWIE